MFRHLEDISNGKLKLKYSCKFPQCWRSYYQVIGSTNTFVNIHFYRFPRKSALLQQWKDICRVTNENCSSYSVCENHFLEQDFINSSRHRLNHGVVPKQLEIAPYSISVIVACYSGISSHTASILQAGLPNNSDCNEGDVELGSEYVHGSLAFCPSMSPNKTMPSISANKVRDGLGIGVAKSRLSLRKSHMYKIQNNSLARLVRVKKLLASERKKFQILRRLYKANKFNSVGKGLIRIIKLRNNSQLPNALRVPNGRDLTVCFKCLHYLFTNEVHAFSHS